MKTSRGDQLDDRSSEVALGPRDQARSAKRSRWISTSWVAITAASLLLSASRLPAACNPPPVPAPGQTVTWLAANSPFQLCSDLTIPATGTVIVEPGVTVQLQAHTITVDGTFNVQGSSTSHVVFADTTVFPPAVTLDGGTIVMTFADFTGQLRSGPGSMTLADCTFTGPNGVIFGLDIFLPSNPPVISVARCNFINSFMTLTDSYVVLTDSIFSNSSATVLRGYARVQGTNVFDGAALSIIREIIQSIQPLSIDGVQATNVAGGGGLSLSGGDFFLGSQNLFQDNLYPVDIEGGLVPGSVVPLTGNTNNLIWAHDGGAGPVARWSNLGLPYLVTASINGGGTLTIDPGVTVLFDPQSTGFAGLNFVSTRRLISRGLPTSPITFAGLTRGNNWNGLIFQTNSTEGNYLNYVTVHDAQFAVSVSDSFLEVNNSLLQSNQVGINTNTFGFANVSKVQLFDNGIGAQITPQGGLLLSGAGLLPNWFEGNGTGVSNSGATIPAELNYWGSPTGPTNPGNPGGTGDVITGSVDFLPFLTAPPDITKTPPIVSLVPLGNSWYGIDTITRPPEFVVQPGEKLILNWSVSSSVGVTTQRVLLSPEGPNFDSPTTPPIVLADNVAATARTIEITIPSVPFAVTNLPQFLRVVAIDSDEQEGWDQTPIIVGSGRITGSLQITTDYTGQTFIGGHTTPRETWSGTTNGSTEGYLFLESDGGLFPTLAADSTRLPIVSTDTARQVVISHNNSNDVKWFFSPGSFSIRPDPALGLSAPRVKLTSPKTGQSFTGGSKVPIRWKAAAQQGLRTFDIQYSANGGQTWHYIAKDLPGTSRRFQWQLPASTGISDVRVRVIARDQLFQDSSNGALTVFSIVP